MSDFELLARGGLEFGVRIGSEARFEDGEHLIRLLAGRAHDVDVAEAPFVLAVACRKPLERRRPRPRDAGLLAAGLLIRALLADPRMRGESFQPVGGRERPPDFGRGFERGGGIGALTGLLSGRRRREYY